MNLSEAFQWGDATVRRGRVGVGPPLILCHGTPWSSFVWRHAVASLSDIRTVYVWDMVGYGLSDMPDGDVSLGTQAELLTSLVQQWQLNSPDVVAHDFGGAVSLRAHLLHGMAVRSFVLVDVVAVRPWGSPFFRLVKQHPDVFARLPPNLHQALVREYIGGASGPGLSKDVLDKLVHPWTGDGQAAFYRQIAQADERYTDAIEPRYNEISVPTLVVWGTADEWIPIERGRQLAAAIPSSEFVAIEGAGHLVQEDRPQELSNTLRSWLVAQDVTD